MRTLEIQVDWIPIKNIDGSIWTFPNPLPRHAGPAVYRWRVKPTNQQDAEFLYIGEAQSLTTRARSVLKPSAKSNPNETNPRLSAFFRSKVANGSVVTLETAAFDEFSFNGVVFSPQDLSHKFKRGALENLLLSCSLALGDKLLNLCIDPDARFKKQLLALKLKNLDSEKVKKIMDIGSPSRNSEETRQRFFETHVGKE
jgi:hypothetical protein